MPGEPRCDLRLVAWRIPIGLAMKVRKRAQALGVPAREVVVAALQHETRDVALVPEEVASVQGEILRNRQRRLAKRARGN